MTSKEKYISSIIPVFNEEKNLDNFLNRICSFKNIDEIICIDDGSQDHSLEILNRYHSKIRIIHFQINKGKGSALSAGIKAAHGEIVLFLDSDLLNLDQKHVQALLDPLFDKSGKAVVGYCRSSEIHIKLAEFISGQRAYYRNDLASHLDEMENMRYGIEMYLNSLFHPMDVKFIPLENLRSAYKFEKNGSKAAARQYYREGREIIQTLPQTILTDRFANIIISRIKNYLPIV